MPIRPCATCGLPATIAPHAPGRPLAVADCGRHTAKPKARAKKTEDTDAPPE